MTAKFIRENLLTTKGKLNNQALMKLSKVQEVPTHQELYDILHSYKQKTCIECGRPETFINFSKGYVGCTNRKCKVVSDKRKKTCLEKYGVETVINRPDVQEKSLKAAASKEARQKAKETCLEKYGVENISQIEEIKRKKEETCLKNFGFKYINQSGLYNFGYNYKDFILPSGKSISIQGYEDKLLTELLEVYNEDDILTDRKDIPEFWYIGEDNKKHRYFPDVYIPSTNTIYEVKSEYTLKADYNKNMLKFKAVKDAGYNFELKIY